MNILKRIIGMQTVMHAAADAPAGAQAAAKQDIQQKVLQSDLGPENRRKLATASYASNSNVIIDIPRDTSIKRMELNLVAQFTVTFASGSPTMSPFGLMAKLCPNFYIVADGSRNIKVLDLYMQRCMNAIAYGGFPRRAYAKAASLVGVNDIPTTEWLQGTVAYPSTTQDIIVNEAVNVDFENPFAWKNKAISQLYTRNLQTCNMTFGFADISAFQTDGVGATVTYSAVTITIVPTIIENRNAGLQSGAFDFNEFVIRKSYSSQQTLAQIDLNAGNRIVGIALLGRDGTAALAATDNVMTDINLLTNGVNPQINTRFRDIMNDNKLRYGVNDDQYASSLHGLSGFAYLPMLLDGDSLSGLDTSVSPGGVSTVQLQVSTNASSGQNALTYTNTVGISALQQQMVPVPPKF